MALAAASESWSKAIRRPSGPNRDRIARECPRRRKSRPHKFRKGLYSILPSIRTTKRDYDTADPSLIYIQGKFSFSCRTKQRHITFRSHTSQHGTQKSFFTQPSSHAYNTFSWRGLLSPIMRSAISPYIPSPKARASS